MKENKATEKKSGNVFVNFYDVETKTSYVFNVNVKDLDTITLRQHYDRDKDRHTTILELPDKCINITPRLDKLGHLSTYISKANSVSVEEKAL